MTELTREKLYQREDEMCGEDYYPDRSARFHEYAQPFLRELFNLAYEALTQREKSGWQTMNDTPDTQALVAEMREAGEGRTDGPWRLDTEVHPKGINDPKQVRYFDQTHQAWSNLAYYWSPKDARFIAYAGTNWNTIADTLEAQSTQLAEAQAEIERLRDALVNLNAPIDKMWSDSFGRNIDEKHVWAITEAQAAAHVVLYKKAKTDD